jgi:hypothetical protein
MVVRQPVPSGPPDTRGLALRPDRPRARRPDDHRRQRHGSGVAILDAEGVVVTARPAFGPRVLTGGGWPITGN